MVQCFGSMLRFDSGTSIGQPHIAENLSAMRIGLSHFQPANELDWACVRSGDSVFEATRSRLHIFGASPSPEDPVPALCRKRRAPSLYERALCLGLEVRLDACLTRERGPL